MSFLKKLAAIFSGGAGPSADSYSLYYYVRCHFCREIVKGRVDLRNELSSEYGDGESTEGYVHRKVLIGRGRCFRPLEVTMTFDARRKLVSQEVTGGEFATEEEYEQQAASAG
jgi:hypothetical protein